MLANGPPKGWTRAPQGHRRERLRKTPFAAAAAAAIGSAMCDGKQTNKQKKSDAGQLDGENNNNNNKYLRKLVELEARSVSGQVMLLDDLGL